MISSDDKLSGQRFADAPDSSPSARLCESPGCAEAGAFRAPKSRSLLREFHWFCLDHVRSYNAAWDYYKGMSEAEIEAETRADSSWQRPTWPLGQAGHAGRLEAALEAELKMFAFGQRPKTADIPAALREPLRVFGLSWPVTLAMVKRRYKELVKSHHPDANQGDSSAEETLKSINLAYAVLRGKLPADPVPPMRQKPERTGI